MLKALPLEKSCWVKNMGIPSNEASSEKRGLVCHVAQNGRVDGKK
jgi:hypothetical protein